MEPNRSNFGYRAQNAPDFTLAAPIFATEMELTDALTTWLIGRIGIQPVCDPEVATNFDWFYLGKMWNDAKENPAGVAGLEDLDDIIEADPLSG